MPALLPHCATYIEDGCNFLSGETRPKLMEVSTDGVINQCKQKHCKHHFFPQDSDIVVECKCPYPKDWSLNIHYDIPIYYSCQLLAGMKVKNAKQCWYVSYSKQSTTLLSLRYSDEVWAKVWSLIKELFDTYRPKLPTNKNVGWLELKKVLSTYLHTHSTLICEIPSMTGNYVTQDNSMHDDIYLHVLPTMPSTIKPNSILSSIKQISIDARCVTEECFELLRKKSNEILAFILTNTDRHKSPLSIAHVPIAYAMKGNSLSTTILRHLIDEVRNECKARKVAILCEVCDGQWMPLVIKDKNGYPLTRLQFQKFIWRKCIAMSKDELLSYLCSFTHVQQNTLDEIALQKDIFLTNGKLIINNFQLMCEFYPKIVNNNVELHKKLTSFTTGAPKSNIPIARYIRTLPTSICSSIWKAAVQRNMPSVEVPPITSADIFSKLPQDVHEDALHLIEDIMNENTINQSFESSDECTLGDDLDNDDIPISKCNILDDILNALRKVHHKDLWNDITARELFNKYLQDAKVVSKYFVNIELDAISKIYKLYFNQKLFNTDDRKQIKVNNLVHLFGDKSTCCTSHAYTYQPNRLSAICKKYLKSASIPKAVIAVPVAFITHLLQLEDWENSFTVPMNIPISWKNINFKLFSYPEFNIERNQLEPRCLDVTHLLTNLRTHACKSGFHGVDKNAFLRASLSDSRYLPRPIIEDLIDQQNSDYAKKVFSLYVQRLMEKNGDYSEATFVKTVRQWYKACDERALSPSERIDRFLAMHFYLTRNNNFNTFPPPSTHYRGIPIVTYEGILQNISTRLSLYQLARGNKYNHRAISTLGVESFFSDLSRVDFTQTGCPKACQIPKIMSAVCEVNNHKHNPSKGFTMDQRRGAPYPATLMDQHVPYATSSPKSTQNVGIFNTHAFDYFPRKHKKRNKYKPNIALPNETERGKLSIRHLYRRNEFKLTALQRLSLPKDYENK